MKQILTFFTILDVPTDEEVNECIRIARTQNAIVILQWHLGERQVRIVEDSDFDIVIKNIAFINQLAKEND